MLAKQLSMKRYGDILKKQVNACSYKGRLKPKGFFFALKVIETVEYMLNRPSLSITNSDTITISTSSRVDKTTTGNCVVGYSNDNYSISNPVISGCDCCSIIIN